MVENHWFRVSEAGDFSLSHVDAFYEDFLVSRAPTRWNSLQDFIERFNWFHSQVHVPYFSSISISVGEFLWFHPSKKNILKKGKEWVVKYLESKIECSSSRLTCMDRTSMERFVADLPFNQPSIEERHFVRRMEHFFLFFPPFSLFCIPTVVHAPNIRMWKIFPPLFEPSLSFSRFRFSFSSLLKRASGTWGCFVERIGDGSSLSV